MRYLLIVGYLFLAGCTGCGNNKEATFAEESPGALAPVTGSGGVWDKNNLFLSDRKTGAVFNFNTAGERFELSNVYRPATTTDSYKATGLSSGDVDGDGSVELFVTAESGAPRLLSNRHGLVDITTESGVVPAGGFKSTFASTFADVDGDGDLDLYVAQSPSFAAIQRACDAAGSTDCSAEKLLGNFPNRLFLNNGHGHFDEAPDALGANHPGATLGLAFADLDADNDLDLYLANDFGPDALYRNDGGRFTEISREAGIYPRGGGMGVAVGDIDGDGRPDLYVTHYGTDTVFLNQGNLRFSDATAAMGVDEYSNGTVGWSTILEDLNHDGRLDVVVARGWWDPDSTTQGTTKQPAYSIALNREGKRFEVTQEGAYGLGSWGLVSNKQGSILTLPPFAGASPTLLKRQ